MSANPPPEVLTTLTEVFIALVGFSGVVIALGRSKVPESARRFRIKVLLFSSSVGLAASVFPSLINEFTADFWSSSAAALGVCMTLNLIWALKNLIPMYKQAQTAPAVFWIVTVITSLLIGLLLFVAINPVPIPPVGVYVVAVSWHVCLAMNHFAQLILSVSWAND